MGDPSSTANSFSIGILSHALVRSTRPDGPLYVVTAFRFSISWFSPIVPRSDGFGILLLLESLELYHINFRLLLLLCLCSYTEVCFRYFFMYRRIKIWSYHFFTFDGQYFMSCVGIPSEPEALLVFRLFTAAVTVSSSRIPCSPSCMNSASLDLA